MLLETLRRTKIEHSGPRNRVKFFGDYKKELEKMLTGLSEVLGKSLTETFTIDSLDQGNNDIKIRVRDESVGSEKIVRAIFRFHHDDEKYGYVHIEILASEVSRKNQSHFLGRYLVTDHAKIFEDVSDAMKKSIRAH